MIGDRPGGTDEAPEGRRTTVLDLDGTIVVGDAFGAFLRHLITRHRVRHAAALLTAPVWLPSLSTPPARLTAERWLVWLAAAGMDETAFATASRRFAERHAGPEGGRTSAAAVARVRRHLADGDRVVVATGCAAPLAHDVCAMAGLDGVEVVASTLVRRRWGPPRRVVPTRAAAKLRALEEVGVTLPVDHAYSDSFSDLPLLLAARTAHVVDPTARDLVRLRRALGEDVEVLRWAGR